MTLTLLDRTQAVLYVSALGDYLAATSAARTADLTEGPRLADERIHTACPGLHTRQLQFFARAIASCGGHLDRSTWLRSLIDWVEVSDIGIEADGSASGIHVPPGRSRARRATANSTSNLALVRGLAPALFHPGETQSACDQARLMCTPSHDSTNAITAACCAAAALSRSLVATSFDEVTGAALQGANIGQWFAGPARQGANEPRVLSNVLQVALHVARESHDDHAFVRQMHDSLGTSDSAVDTMAAVLGVLQYTQGDPLRTLSIASKLAGDSQAVATVAGAIAGAWRGLDGVPLDLVRAHSERQGVHSLDELAVLICDSRRRRPASSSATARPRG